MKTNTRAFAFVPVLLVIAAVGMRVRRHGADAGAGVSCLQVHTFSHRHARRAAQRRRASSSLPVGKGARSAEEACAPATAAPRRLPISRIART